MDKVAIYCRLSDEDRNKKNTSDDSESIQNQKNLLMKYALEKGWDIYKIYSDDDYSGLDSARPEFNEMIRDAEGKKFNIILCKTQSRFTRDMELVEKYLHNRFLQWGVRFVTMVDGVDTQDKHNKKSRQINGLVNEWYCEDISESIKAVFRMKQQTGKFIGSFASYGYMKDPNDKGRLILDEEASDVVKLVFSLYLDGHGTQSIANILNDKGVLNPTRYKQQKGMKYCNPSSNDDYGLWNKTTIKRILKNEIYIGNMVQHKRHKVNYKSKKIKELDKSEWIIVEAVHEPIINKDIFHLVQRKMSSRTKSTGVGKVHMLAGKVKCMDCKGSMNKMSNGSQYNYLRCKLYSVAPKKELCTSHSIKLEELEKIVETKIKEQISKSFVDYVDNNCKSSEQNRKTSILQKDLKKINSDLETCSDALKNLYLDKIKGVISQSQFNDLNNTFLFEKEKLINRRDEINGKIDYLGNNKSDKVKFFNTLKKYGDFNELKHSMITELIDYIEVGEKTKNKKERKINIHWNL